jgi:hypothetical protein
MVDRRCGEVDIEVLGVYAVRQVVKGRAIVTVDLYFVFGGWVGQDRRGNCIEAQHDVFEWFWWGVLVRYSMVSLCMSIAMITTTCCGSWLSPSWNGSG